MSRKTRKKSTSYVRLPNGQVKRADSFKPDEWNEPGWRPWALPVAHHVTDENHTAAHRIEVQTIQRAARAAVRAAAREDKRKGQA